MIVSTNHHFLFNGTILKAFNIDDSNIGVQSHDLGQYHGYRFDHNNHNWIINKQYMATSFSYMCFVIKDKLENHDINCSLNKFDVTPYNYIFNRSSSFLDSEFVAENYLILEDILKNCMKHDDDIID